MTLVFFPDITDKRRGNRNLKLIRRKYGKEREVIFLFSMLCKLNTAGHMPGFHVDLHPVSHTAFIRTITE